MMKHYKFSAIKPMVILMIGKNVMQTIVQRIKQNRMFVIP